MINTFGWTVSEWRAAYRNNTVTVSEALHSVRATLNTQDPTWIYILSETELDAQINALGSPELPLYGIPFAVKDNIDVAGIPTTAACPAFTYVANEDATCVARLKAAGAIVIGKTNLDQFATGLVGTRSPYGAVPNAFNADYVSGGSSSGSGVAVARGLVPFSLGTDTAGSGRIPAGFNNIVGLKPTKGRFSTSGVVPACRSLDCVSIFSLTVSDAELIASQIDAFDSKDGFSRIAQHTPFYFSDQPCFGIPEKIEWFGDTEAALAWDVTLTTLRAMGVDIKPIDFTPMSTLASLLYGGAWVAERHAAIAEFMADHAEEMNPIVRHIIQQAEHFSATDAYRSEYRRADLARDIQTLMANIDALLVPTSPRHPTIAQVNADPVNVNSQLGTYTNFVNLADCCALALPAVIRNDGLPFGITVIAPAWQDVALSAFGKKWQQFTKLPLGHTQRLLPQEALLTSVPKDYVRLAVVGAHLTGMPLNSQLQERKALFVESTFTSNSYRLFALPNTTPPKPGLMRVNATETGAKISVELWDVPLQHFGSFVALIPAPLGIGTLTLHDGRNVKGFICEAFAVAEATDITHLGGWRAYIQSLQH